ncbi:MAG TPA: hypothetical protein VFC00_20070 [Micromonosporaceae bacterium]|nr:hypothetical protein [Micromonosporaceae bacterium]
MGTDTIEVSPWFTFGGRDHRDPRDLAEALATTWDGARALVLGPGVERLRSYLAYLNLPDPTQQVTEDSADVCVARLIALLDPSRPPSYRSWTLDASGLSRLAADATGHGSRRHAALAAVEVLSEGRIFSEYDRPGREWLADLSTDWRQAGEAFFLQMRQVPRRGQHVEVPGAAKVTTLAALVRLEARDELARRADRAASRTVAAEAEWFRAMANTAHDMPPGPARIGAQAAVMTAVPVAREDGRQARAQRRLARAAARRRQDRRLVGWTVAACATAVVPTFIGYLMHGRRVLVADPQVQPGDRLRPLSQDGTYLVEAYTNRYALAMWLAGSAILLTWLAVLLVSRSWRRRFGAVVFALLLLVGSGEALRAAGRMWTEEEQATLQRVLHEPYPYRSRYPTCSVEQYVFALPDIGQVTWVVGSADTRRGAVNPAKLCVSIDVYAGWRRTAHLDLPAGEVISPPFIQVGGPSPGRSHWAAVVVDAATGKGKYLTGFALATPSRWRLADPVFVNKPVFVVVGTVAIFDAGARGVVGIDIAGGRRAWNRNCPGGTVYGGIVGRGRNGAVIRCGGRQYDVAPNGSIKAT